MGPSALRLNRPLRTNGHCGTVPCKTITTMFHTSNGPGEFARALATMVAQKHGPQVGPIELTHSFVDVPKILTLHPAQLLYMAP